MPDKLGIVTDVDEQFVYVWNEALGVDELKYPVNPTLKIKPGEIVAFTQSRGIDEVQNMKDIAIETEHEVAIEESQTVKWKAKVNLTFAPLDSMEYQTVMGKNQRIKTPVKAVAYAEDILCSVEKMFMVPSFTAGINYKVGVVYKAYVTRVPRANNEFVKEVGSLFLIVGKNFQEETDESTKNRVLQKCPWNSPRKNTVAINGPELSFASLTNGGTSPRKTVAINGPELSFASLTNGGTFHFEKMKSTTEPSSSKKIAMDVPFYNEEPLAVRSETTNVANDQEDESLGLIVHCEAEYSVLWSPIRDLVRIQLGYNEERNPQNGPTFSIGQWIHFRCFEDLSQIYKGLHCSYTAYSVQKIANALAPKEVMLIGKNIVAKLSLGNKMLHSRQYSLAEDSFFGGVLCSAEDLVFSYQFKSKSAPVKVYAVYSDEYKFSKWIAFAYLNKEDSCWKKVVGLPRSIVNREIITFLENNLCGIEATTSREQNGNIEHAFGNRIDGNQHSRNIFGKEPNEDVGHAFGNPIDGNQHSRNIFGKEQNEDVGHDFESPIDDGNHNRNIFEEFNEEIVISPTTSNDVLDTRPFSPGDSGRIISEIDHDEIRSRQSSWEIVENHMPVPQPLQAKEQAPEPEDIPSLLLAFDGVNLFEEQCSSNTLNQQQYVLSKEEKKEQEEENEWKKKMEEEDKKRKRKEFESFLNEAVDVQKKKMMNLLQF